MMKTNCAVAAVAVMAVGCSDPSVVLVPDPGSIVVTVETQGFMKDDSYEVLVGGESQGTISNGGEVTVDALDPGSYEVSLGDVSENCLVAALTVDVETERATDATFAVTCAYDAPQSYTLRFSRERPDLETGAITECPFSICPSGAEWDMYVHYSSASDPNSVIRQNETDGVEITHLAGVTLATLAEADLANAVFTTALIGDAFDAGRVIMIRTGTGFVYALGNPVEDDTAQVLTFDVALIERP